MDRRELIKMIGVLTGGVVIGSEVFLTGCSSGAKYEVGFTPGNLALLDEVGETILPATTSPGAKAVKIADFMKTIVTDCYSEEDQKAFNEGLKKIQEACKKSKDKDFMECTPAERTAFLVELDKEAKVYQKEKSEFDKQQENKRNETLNNKQKDFVKETRPNHYFTMLKQLTLWGYFTSKEGVMKSLNYRPVPGKFIGCIDYKKGDKVQVGLT